MKYRIELAATAKADIRRQTQWLRDQVSPAYAVKWLKGLYKAIDSVRTRPTRSPLASESDRYPEEIRELLHGGSRRHKHRIIFTLRKDIIYVLYVRHTARDALEPLTPARRKAPRQTRLTEISDRRRGPRAASGWQKRDRCTIESQ